MKKNKTEQKIVELIKQRQLELAIKATENALKAIDNPPKTISDSMKLVGKTLGLTLRVAQLQKALRIIEPKPNFAKGGIVGEKQYIEFANGRKVYTDKSIEK